MHIQYQTNLQILYTKVLTDKLIPTHSHPITILSYNGKEYEKRIVEVCNKLKIERIYTSPYYQKSNGKPEGWYRMLHDSMTKMIQADESIWNELIPKY